MNSRAVHALVAAGIAVIGVIWLTGIADLPPCPLATYLSFLCPMCGSTRAVEAAASGEMALAFQLNPLFPFWSAVVGLVIIDLLWAIGFGPEAHGPCRRLLTAMSKRRWAMMALGLSWVGTIVYLNVAMRDVLLHP